MVRACLEAKASYVDVTGELAVFQSTFARLGAARERGVCLMSGVGFDVIPTDCLAKHVADRVPGATELHIAFASDGTASAGTLKSAIEGLPRGGFSRRGGELVSEAPAAHVREVRFSDRTRTVMSVPWGDLETAFHTTGIPDITTYIGQKPSAARLIQRVGPIAQRAFSFTPLRRAVQALVERTVAGPTEEARTSGRSQIWAKAANRDGKVAEAWLETLEGYRFTAIGGVRAVERILEMRPVGALTPAKAFGADFVLEIEGTKRWDALP
jgi:short subunit dehydrogenase-like uncharacterized protein